MQEIISNIRKSCRGHDIYIVGGGSSLDGFDFGLLNDKKCITINESAKLVTESLAILWTDNIWGANNSDFLYKTPAPKFRVLNKNIATNYIDKQLKTEGDSYVLSCSSEIGLDRNPYGVSGNNTGAYALNFCHKLSPKRIYLLGYDLRTNPKTKKSNFHNNYSLSATDEIYKSLFLKSTQSIVDAMMDDGIEIFNINIDSRLKTKKEINIHEWCNIQRSSKN